MFFINRWAYSIDNISLSNPDDFKRRKAVERLKEYIELASELNNALVIIGVIKGLVNECESKKQYINNFMKSLEECLNYALKKDIVLVMESINKKESDIFNNIDECSRFIKSFQTPNLKLHIDTYHMDLEESSILSDVEKVADIISLVDIIR